jgi:hypothetical protein
MEKYELILAELVFGKILEDAIEAKDVIASREAIISFDWLSPPSDERDLAISADALIRVLTDLEAAEVVAWAKRRSAARAFQGTQDEKAVAGNLVRTATLAKFK